MQFFRLSILHAMATSAPHPYPLKRNGANFCDAIIRIPVGTMLTSRIVLEMHILCTGLCVLQPFMG